MITGSIRSKRASVTAFLLAAGALAGLAVEPVMVRSKSGQFVVRGLLVEAPAASTLRTARVDRVQLDPALVAVAFERIKGEVLRELGLRDDWKGTVFASIQPATPQPAPITITALRHTDGWNYRLTLPQPVDRERLVEAVVQVLLREIANRRTPDRMVELPPWLAKGIGAHLLTESPALLVPEPFTRTAAVQRNVDPLRRVREVLQAHPALTLNELSMPGAALDTPIGAAVYRHNAYLFVHSLLRLRKGRDSMREMLLRLSQTFNWQTAFLQAYRAHFPRFIDADKWWSLQAVRLRSAAPGADWSRDETLRQLEAILTTNVDVRSATNDLPLSGHARLQTIVTAWEFARQQPVLAYKLNQLQALIIRTPPELIQLVDAYRRVLADYVAARQSWPWPDTPARRRQPAFSVRQVIDQTVNRLDDLDWLRHQSQRGSSLERAAVAR